MPSDQTPAEDAAWLRELVARTRHDHTYAIDDVDASRMQSILARLATLEAKRDAVARAQQERDEARAHLAMSERLAQNVTQGSAVAITAITQERDEAKDALIDSLREGNDLLAASRAEGARYREALKRHACGASAGPKGGWWCAEHSKYHLPDIDAALAGQEAGK